MWRSLLTGEINSATDVHWWAWEAYELLYTYTGNEKWKRAADTTKYSTVITSVVENPTHWYKQENNPDPFAYPGTQVVQANNTNGYTASRVTSGTFLNFIQLAVNAAPNGTFPSIEVQKFRGAGQDRRERYRVGAGGTIDRRTH
jgi:hypothetical protein